MSRTKPESAVDGPRVRVADAELAVARPLPRNAFKVPLARNVIASTLLELVEAVP
jgi:xanthine dehydrogenase YagS FAD-binding subunit